MKRLYLLRHAKTEQANKDTPADASRMLTETGRRDAPKIGRAMRAKGYLPDLILCSPSTRTRQTLDLANTELRSAAPVEFVNAIYAASAARLLTLFQDLPEVRAPLIVGHNPGFEDSAKLLISSKTAPGEERAGEKFPTSALLVLDFAINAWKELVPRTGAVADFIRPKDLSD
ncbi:MAG TPA: histidine phosphatase family protein [Rhizomicrobium sp.]|jgi:phosphohistidine phosphatase|nr:histidine phosphatase family protein [Rhizomicrobium sp.]